MGFLCNGPMRLRPSQIRTYKIPIRQKIPHPCYCLRALRSVRIQCSRPRNELPHTVVVSPLSERNLMLPHLPPSTDPTALFDLVRGNFQTELLACAQELGIFARLGKGPASEEELRMELGLAHRPFTVLTCAMRAMNLLHGLPGAELRLTELGRFLVPGYTYDITGYVGLTSQLPGVQHLLEQLRNDKPGDNRPGEGRAFIYREGMDSAMEDASTARRLTLALSGRAAICAPALASILPLERVTRLLDLGGGSGIYSVALARANPLLQVTLLDRPSVLETANDLLHGEPGADRVQLLAGDLFHTYPKTEAILLSNVLHDWDLPMNHEILTRCHEALPEGGRVFIHDVFLNDGLDGPLPEAMYSAALYSLTEGRAYSRAEYRGMLRAAGFVPTSTTPPTAVHCGVLAAIKAN